MNINYNNYFIFFPLLTVNNTKYFWLFSPTQLLTLREKETYKQEKHVSFQYVVYMTYVTTIHSQLAIINEFIIIIIYYMHIAYTCTYVHTYIHIYIHTHVHIYITYIHMYICTYILTYIRTYTCTYIHYIHTYIHT